MVKSYSIEELRAMLDGDRKQRKKHNEHREHDMQVICVNWFSSKFPHLEPFFWSTPSGGYRSKKTAIDMKKEGQKSGVPDLFLAYPNNNSHGLFIEMKKSDIGKKGQLIGKGRLSKSQEERIAKLREVGFIVEVCYTFEQFKEIITQYLMPKQ